MNEKVSPENLVESDARKTIDNLFQGKVLTPTIRDLKRAVEKAHSDRSIGNLSGKK